MGLTGSVSLAQDPSPLSCDHRPRVSCAQTGEQTNVCTPTTAVVGQTHFRLLWCIPSFV